MAVTDADLLRLQRRIAAARRSAERLAKRLLDIHDTAVMTLVPGGQLRDALTYINCSIAFIDKAWRFVSGERRRRGGADD